MLVTVAWEVVPISPPQRRCARKRDWAKLVLRVRDGGIQRLGSGPSCT